MHLESSSGFGVNPHPKLGQRIFAQSLAMLDRYLRRRQGVYEYSRSPRCIFRVEIGANPDDIRLSDGRRIAAGAPVANLHFWNEQVPVMPESGATVRWAIEMQRCVGHSLDELADYLDRDREVSDVRGIHINLAIANASRGQQAAGLMERFGFERLETAKSMSLIERLHLIGENILISMFVLAQNPSALRGDTLWRNRIRMAMSRELLSGRYGRRAQLGP